MSKMSDIAMTIEELRNAAAAITDVANYLDEIFSGNATEEQPETKVPAQKSALTLEQVRAVLADKARQGYNEEIRTLLQKYGAAKLSEIAPVHYKALLTEAEVLKDAK